MADKLQSSVQGATSQAQDAASEGTKKWDAMSEEQKKKAFDSLPEDKKKGMSYTEWIKEGYYKQYENWMPWIEQLYLRWFTNDNKASYATKGKWALNDRPRQWTPKLLAEDRFYLTFFISITIETDTLDKSKVTGVEQVDKLQDGVNNLVSQQVGQGGLLQPAGDLASKEGINRAERGGKDDTGSYGGAASGVTDPVANNAKAAGEGAASKAQGLGSSVWSGAKSAGGYVGGMLGGEKKEGSGGSGWCVAMLYTTTWCGSGLQGVGLAFSGPGFKSLRWPVNYEGYESFDLPIIYLKQRLKIFCRQIEATPLESNDIDFITRRVVTAKDLYKSILSRQKW